MPPTEIPELPDYSPGALDSFFGEILAQFDQDAAAATTVEAVEQLRIRWIGRKQKKRQFRSLWIVRIGAAAKLNGISYSQLIHGLKLGGIDLDRKILADLAVNDPAGFTALTDQAKSALTKTAA